MLTIINGAVTDFPEPTALDAGDEMMGRFTVGSAAERSYIPATVENRMAIDGILTRMEELRHAIADVLSQDNIELNLVKDALRVLPGPR